MFNKVKPRSIAYLRGGPLRPQINGTVWFLDAPEGGAYLVADIKGLPPYSPKTAVRPPIGPFGFHIHEGSCCKVGDSDQPFMAAGGHYNPDNQAHGNHAGDLPNLFAMDGRATMVFYTNRFSPIDVVGRTVIIHQNPDDGASQPDGRAGLRLACGEVMEAIE
ncbi:MAG: superoxide dismutase family protein [Firmicutes bacterium]|nr:superoxide dismutase family protein [Bacillota bacterium]MDD4262891.1 superoxide dismutase family protein [Bacillota bacterium]MDD4693502.1 superoxide dismutase family protein [Bacillota bacterium]